MCNSRESSCSSESFFSVVPGPVSPTAGESLRLSSSFLGRNEEELRNWGGNNQWKLSFSSSNCDGRHRLSPDWGRRLFTTFLGASLLPPLKCSAQEKQTRYHPRTVGLHRDHVISGVFFINGDTCSAHHRWIISKAFAGFLLSNHGSSISRYKEEVLTTIH